MTTPKEASRLIKLFLSAVLSDEDLKEQINRTQQRLEEGISNDHLQFQVDMYYSILKTIANERAHPAPVEPIEADEQLPSTEELKKKYLGPLDPGI